MTTWTLVIPVKALAAAKSRLAPAVTPPVRLALARAFALDTIETSNAARSVDRIVVVTGEVDLDAHLPHGVDVLHESPGAGLGSAVELGVAAARSDGDVAVAVLLGDLPALHTDGLESALHAAARHPLAFVPDADGTGTTLVTAQVGESFTPAFGDRSAARHAAAGFTDLVEAEPDSMTSGVRRDVDTVEALEDALLAGVGPHTAEVVAALADGALPHAPAGEARRTITDPHGKGTS
ncbi:2-phospho-L-lactate guanylyltransferase [Agromyces sp. NPDC058484]|uniref:2-phospho-L-lactate guanylyltransferase n=1 Tax=Agromyces sp. NPDC058484 TaxID=3346524 RepID=UPI00365733B7